MISGDGSGLSGPVSVQSGTAAGVGLCCRRQALTTSSASAAVSLMCDRIRRQCRAIEAGIVNRRRRGSFGSYRPAFCDGSKPISLVQAIRSATSMTMAHQIGGRSFEGTGYLLRCLSRSESGPRTVPCVGAAHFQGGQLPAGVVDRDGGQPVPVDVVEPQLPRGGVQPGARSPASRPAVRTTVRGPRASR